VENPVAFASGLTKLLSMAHLHAQYAALMVAPVQMCADWSYRCVALVEGLRDWRNLLSAATYGWFVAMLLLGRPWEVIWEGLYGPSKARCSQPYTSHITTLALQTHFTGYPGETVTGWASEK
jgi:hypothetical protein